jgi:hypothetical protein
MLALRLEHLRTPWTYADLVVRTPLAPSACQERLTSRADETGRLPAFRLGPRGDRPAYVQIEDMSFTMILKSEHARRVLAFNTARGKLRRTPHGSEIQLRVGQDRRLIWVFVVLNAMSLGMVAGILTNLLVGDPFRESLPFLWGFVIASLMLPAAYVDFSQEPEAESAAELLAFVLDTLDATLVVLPKAESAKPRKIAAGESAS